MTACRGDRTSSQSLRDNTVDKKVKGLGRVTFLCWCGQKKGETRKDECSIREGQAI